jgi:hypothetical protein
MQGILAIWVAVAARPEFGMQHAPIDSTGMYKARVVNQDASELDYTVGELQFLQSL